MPIRILIAEPQTVLRQALAAWLDTQDGLTVVCQCETAERALACIETHHVDGAFVDYELPDMNGLRFLKKAMALMPGLRCIFLTMHTERSLIEKAFHEGAMAYLPKTVELEELLRAVNAVMAGRPYICSRLSRSLLRKPPSKRAQVDDEISITNEEARLLTLAGLGKETKEIAQVLGITVTLVKHRFADLYRHMGVRNRSQAIYRAMELGLIPLIHKLP